MVVKLAAVLALASLLLGPGPVPVNAGRSFLVSAFQLSAAEMDRLNRGDVVTRTLEVKNRRELATLGIVRIGTTPSDYVERLTDIATFKRTDGILQIGTFSEPPKLDDMAALTIDEADLQRLRECRVENCHLRLSAEAIEDVRRDVNWRTPDGSRQANRLVSQLLVDYVGRYRRSGSAAAMEYADRSPRLNVGQEFVSMLEGDTITSAYTPRLRRHLLDYPASSIEKTTDFVYWSKELVRGRPVISITHVAIVASVSDSPVAYAIGSKQIYAMHYYDASLGLTLLVPDTSAAKPATYVIYVNRSRIDLFDGLVGGVARHVVAGRARALVAEQLQRLQRVLGSR